MHPLPCAPTRPDGHLTELWRALAALSEPAALATVIGVDGSAPRHSGARMLVFGDGSIVGTVGGGNFEYNVIATARRVIAGQAPERMQVHLTRDLGMCCGGAMDVYIEPVNPSPRLVIYGAGHVALPTAAVARSMGFVVTVVDERDEFATAERFPGCEVLCTDPRRHARALAQGGYVLIVTHEHKLDQDLLETLIAREWVWLGLIGSRAKVAKFFLRLRAAGIDEALFARVSAPVGLDIGAETPEEIAVSIAAELVRVRRGHTAAPGTMAVGGIRR